ncbi:MAG: hypothetical protein GY913_28425 [Proteobacteria bacterium]|nr:hypothetical protein [Pseudomonadota bacterium]
MDVLELTGCVVDLDRERVVRGDDELKLTTKEVALLRYLAERPGELVTHEALLVEVWGYAPTVQTRAIANAVARLRKKIERNPREPDHLFTVYGGGFRLRTLVARAAPAQEAAAIDPLVGRRDELDAIERAFAQGARLVTLVTLVGPGGAGKTRLAREKLGDRTLFVRLEEATAPLQACIAVAGSLRVSVGSLAVEQIGRELGRMGELLLILDNLDNLEQLDGSGLVERWLLIAPELRVLATSRHSLGFAAEQVVPVGPLPIEDARAVVPARGAPGRRGCAAGRRPGAARSTAAGHRAGGLAHGRAGPPSAGDPAARARGLGADRRRRDRAAGVDGRGAGLELGSPRRGRAAGASEAGGLPRGLHARRGQRGARGPGAPARRPARRPQPGVPTRGAALRALRQRPPLRRGARARGGRTGPARRLVRQVGRRPGHPARRPRGGPRGSGQPAGGVRPCAERRAGSGRLDDLLRGRAVWARTEGPPARGPERLRPASGRCDRPGAHPVVRHRACPTPGR